MNHEGRIQSVRATLADHELDALLVTDLKNVRYLTGFSGSNGQVLITTNDATFFTDPRYKARAGSLVSGARIEIYEARLTDLLPGLLRDVRRLGVESTTMTIDECDTLGKKLEPELVSTKNAIEELRRVKDDEEIAAIREAIRLTDEAYEKILTALVPGALERDIALELEILLRRSGADAVSFEPIVGSGPLSAHIHHTPSDRPFERGDFVLLDFGCIVDGYCSDCTRTLVLGPASDEQKEQYALVLEAQNAGIGSIRAGVSGIDADAAARKVIEAAGRGDEFGHGLGHGIGLDIHEAPRLHRISEDVLRAGEVVTVEPGVYIENSGGVRIEDDVLVTSEGAEVLTKAPKHELIQLDV